MNIHAPDEGNIHLLEVVATPEQKERWLKPMVQCVRDVLKNNVLPLLQGDAKRDVLMVMNAMSIAQ